MNWCQESEGRKEGKDEEITGETIRPVRETEDSAVLEELREWEQAKERKGKNIESKRKLWEIYNEKESREWKEKESFFAQIVSLSAVISI